MILISGRPFSGHEQLARHLAAACGLRCVEPQAIIERAAAWGAAHEDLWNALGKPQRIRDRLSHRRRRLLALLESALAEEVRSGAAVCCGNLVELLPEDASFVFLRIHVRVPTSSRVERVQERLKIPETEAANLIARLDREQRRWLCAHRGVDDLDTMAHDLVVDFDHVSIEGVAETAERVVRTRLDSLPGSRRWRAIEDYALSRRVKAALVVAQPTAHLQMEVEAEDGAMRLLGKLPGSVDLRDVEHVARQVDGVEEIDSENIRPVSSEGMPAPELNPGYWRSAPLTEPLRSGWHPKLAVYLVLCLVIGATWAIEGLTSPIGDGMARVMGSDPTALVGFVTNTRCGGVTQMDAECVRRCVREDSGARYALFDGDNLYIFSDQTAPEQFAAQRVRVTGHLNTVTNAIRAESIRPVS